MPNQLVQWWRTQRPDDASLSDEDLTTKIADLAPQYAKNGRDIFAEYPDFASDYDIIRKNLGSEYRQSTTTLGEEVGRGLQRGISGLKSTAYGAAALAADAIPGQFADPARDAMLRKYKVAQEEASQEDVAPAVSSYKGVDDLRSAGQYVAGLAGEGLPSVAESLLTGAAGAIAGSEVPVAGNIAGGIAGIVGKQAAKRLIAKKIAGYTAQEIEEAAIKGVGSEALKQLVRAETKAITSTAGALLANTLNSYGLSAGEIYGDLATNPNVKIEDALGIAVTAAIPAAIADTALPGYVINKSGVLRRLAGQIENFGETEKRGFFGYIARLAAEVPKVSTMEAGTEAFQELVNIAAAKYGETGKLDLSLTEADKERIINAGFAGAVAATTTAPMAAARFDKTEQEAAAQAPAAAAAVQAQPGSPAAPTDPAAATAQPATPDTATDVLEAGYDTNIDGIKDLARRKLAGDDVSAEEAALKPDAARRYQREVVAAAEAKAATESAAPTEAPVPAPVAVALKPTVGVRKTSEFGADKENREYQIDAGGQRAGQANLARNEDGTWRVEMVTVDTPGMGIGPMAYEQIHSELEAEGSGLTSGSAGSLSESAIRMWEKLVSTGKAEKTGETYRMKPTSRTVSVEVPGGEGAQAAAQVTEGGSTPVQEAPSKVEEGEELELSAEDSAAKQSMSKDAKAAQSQVELLKKKIAAIEKLAEQRSKEIEPAQELMSRYIAADAIPDKGSREQAVQALKGELKKYGGVEGLQKRLETLNVLETDKNGKPKLLLKPIKDDPRKTASTRLNYYAKKLNEAQSKLMMINDDIDTLMMSAAPSERSRMPAYYESGDESDQSGELMRLYGESLKAKGLARQTALNELGYTLTADARGKDSNQRHSRRLTAWVKRSEAGNPAEILVTTSHREPIPTKSKSEFNPVDRYVFAVSNTEYLQSGAKKKATEKKAEVRTITQMIDDGFMPYSSILLGSARHRSVERLAFQEGGKTAIEQYSEMFNEAKQAAAAGNPIETEFGKNEDEIINDAAKTAAEELSDAELEYANGFFQYIRDQFMEQSAELLDKGRFSEALEQSLLGKMIGLYDEMVSKNASETDISNAFSRSFKSEIEGFLKQEKKFASARDMAVIAETLPSYFAGSALRATMSARADALKQTYQDIKLNALKKSIGEKNNENNQSTSGTKAVSPTGAAGKADRNGGGDSKGNRSIPKEDAKAKVAKAGKAAAGSVAPKKRTASRADVAKATAAKADKSKRTDSASNAKKRAAKSDVVKRETKYVFNPKTGLAEQVSNKVIEAGTPAPVAKPKNAGTKKGAAPKKGTKPAAPEQTKPEARPEPTIEQRKEAALDIAYLSSLASPTEPTIEQRKEAALEAVAKLLAAKQIKRKDYNSLIDAINSGTPAQIQDILDKSQAAESSAKDSNSVVALKETVLNLEEEGLIDKVVRKAMLKKIDQNASNPGALAKFEQELKDYSDRESKKTRKRLSQADPDAIDSVDLQSGRIIPVELVPSSIENIEHNIRRFSPPARSLLTQSMDAESVSQKYPDLIAALRRIAIEAATDSSPMSVIRATIAKAMMDRVANTGAKLIFVDQSITPGVLGKFDLRNNEIVIYTGAHSTDLDLQATILEETLHAFTSKARLAFGANPESLSPALRDAITGLNSLIEAAKKAGLKWQESDSADAAVAFDEFVAAAVRDSQFQSQLAQVPFNKDFGIKKATTLLEAIKLQFSKILEAIVSAFPIFGSEGKAGGMTALDASAAFINAMVTNHQKVASSTLNDTRYQRSVVDDASYLAAVQAGDMETAQRMVDQAAKAAGYNIGPVWHYTTGDSADFTQFDKTKAKLGAFFFSPENQNKSGRPDAKLKGQFYLSLKNPRTVTSSKSVGGVDNSNAYYSSEGLSSSGFDGLIGTEPSMNSGRAVSEYVIFDPNKIKSADAVTRDNQGGVIPLSQRFQAENPDVRYQRAQQRYRYVEGTLGTGAEITVDGSKFSSDATAEAKRLMALQNLIQDAATRMVDMWNRKGNNRSSQGTQLLSNDQAIKSMILDMISSSMPLPSDAKQAINKALSDQGASTISDAITMVDLEQKSDAPKVARDGLNALNTVLFNLKRMRAEAEELFGKKNILQKIADSSFEISELTKKFEDMNFIGKEFVKELRRSIDESEDVGAGSIAKAMGMTTGRKASLQSAATWIQANLDAYTDALVALSELGVDFNNAPPADILKTVNAAAATDARLVPMQDIGRLAMAGQFARRRPMVMDFLATRSSGEAGALRSIVAMATSSRSDAIEMAKRDLPKLKRIGGIAARIIDKLSEMKAQHRKMLDQSKLHAEREQFAIDSEAALVDRIKYLERMLQVEDASENKLWQPHHNATYFVPTSPNQSEESLFDYSPTSQSFRKLRFGQDFDGAKVRSELALMKGWLDSNQNLRGTSKYNLMKRQIDGLTKVYAEEVDANVRRGPFGFLVRALGSSADRLEQLGLLSTKEAATMIRRYVSSFEQSLKSVEAKSFHEFDALMRSGTQLSGLHPLEFKRQYYNRALGYLETRQDLLNPALSQQAQEDLLVREAIRFMDQSTPMSDELKSAVGNLLRTAGRNGEIIIGRNRVNFGLKVADVMKDGRVYLREPIGHPLSTAARSLNESVRVLANKMEAAWKETFTANGEPDNKLKPATVSGLYTTDLKGLRLILAGRFTDDVMSKFVNPLVSKTGKTNFKGPENLGVVDMAKRENLIEAYRLAGGDIIKFAEELHRLEGGDPATLADFVGETIGTFQKYASTLFQVADTAGKNVDEDADPGLNFLNARQGEDFPWEWLDYKEYGYKNRTRYLRVMAQQFAFGDGQDGFNRLVEESRRQLMKFMDEYEDAHKKLNAGDRAGYEKALNEGGNRIARQNAQANLLELNSAEKHHSALMKELNGNKQSAGVFSEILGVISGMTVQGLATAATDSVTLFEAPLRKFGFSKEAIQFISGTWNAVGTEIAGSLAQAFGMQFHQDTATARETDILNRNGLADSDSITSSRGFAALHERYIQELADELTFTAITERYKNERITMAKELAAGAIKRAAKAGKVFLESGIGQAKDESQAFATLKLLNPFTQASIWMHRATARQWLRTINNSILKAEIYFKAHPQAESDPNFRFTAKELGYSGKTLTGMKLDNRAWEFLSEKLAQSGISLEDSARKKMRGQDPLDFNQIQSALGLAQTEILLNTSPVTRPAWSQDTLAGRLSTPLIGWALYKTADVAKSATGPKSKGDLKAFISFMEAMMLGVLPISLAYAFLRDEYEEEVLKKKQNVMPLRLDATLPAAMLDATSRLGMLGIIGEIPNSIVNQSTQREVSIDSRVFAVSSALNLMKTMSTLYNQGGTVTFQSVVRPMMQSFGGSGYLQNFDAINGLTGMDNVESRLAKRINVGNQLRVAGRMNELEIRGGKGMVTTSNPVKPHVVNMALSAYANDARSFRESYQKALQAAKEAYPDSDPYEKVASAFESQHPLKSVFASRPSSADYQKMLRSMGDNAAEVSTAIRNLNAYGSQVLTKRGGSGIKPFYGTETTKRSTDYRTMITR